MRCLRGRSTPLCLALAAVAFTFAGPCPQSPQAAEPPHGDPAIVAMGASLEKAFNAHDAAAIGARWTDGAIHRSVSGGTQVSGRQAIVDAYARLFAADPGCRLSVSIQRATVKSATAATVTGVAQVEHQGRAPTRSLFEAKLARVGADWLLARVDETDLPADAVSAMRPLAWLVGRWAEELPDGSVVNEFRWMQGGTFLHRDYRCQRKGQPRLEGTQVFGWDAERSCIRTWLFDSSGSFGEGYWEAAGPSRWLNTLAIKLPDGRRAAATQVLERKGNDQLTLQLIGREIDGAAQPNGPVATLVRTSDPSQKSPASAGSTKGDQP